MMKVIKEVDVPGMYTRVLNRRRNAIEVKNPNIMLKLRVPVYFEQ